jgi:hypothetical protein
MIGRPSSHPWAAERPDRVLANDTSCFQASRVVSSSVESTEVHARIRKSPLLWTRSGQSFDEPARTGDLALGTTQSDINGSSRRSVMSVGVEAFSLRDPERPRQRAIRDGAPGRSRC